MKIQAHNTETFDKNKRWYLVFGAVFTIILTFLILNKSISGAIVLFLILGGYFYFSVVNNQLIYIEITKEGLIIGKKIYNRNILTGYVLEIDKNTQKIKNIIFVTNKSHSIHTLKDNKENIKNFIVELNDYLPMLNKYDQDFIEKLSRKLKL